MTDKPPVRVSDNGTPDDHALVYSRTVTKGKLVFEEYLHTWPGGQALVLVRDDKELEAVRSKLKIKPSKTKKGGKPPKELRYQKNPREPIKI